MTGGGSGSARDKPGPTAVVSPMGAGPAVLAQRADRPGGPRLRHLGAARDVPCGAGVVAAAPRASRQPRLQRDHRPALPTDRDRVVLRDHGRRYCDDRRTGGCGVAVAFREQVDPAALEAWIDGFGITAPLVFVAVSALASVLFLPGMVMMLALMTWGRARSRSITRWHAGTRCRFGESLWRAGFPGTRHSCQPDNGACRVTALGWNPRNGAAGSLSPAPVARVIHSTIFGIDVGTREVVGVVHLPTPGTFAYRSDWQPGLCNTIGKNP